MNKNTIQDIIVDLHSETASLSDPKTKDTFNGLLNLIVGRSRYAAERAGVIAVTKSNDIKERMFSLQIQST